MSLIGDALLRWLPKDGLMPAALGKARASDRLRETELVVPT